MSDWIDDYMEFTENSEPPRLYRRWVAVSTVAAALQRKCFLKWGHLRWFPNFYIVLVGPPGRCRKGTAMADGRQFLRKLGIPIAAEAITREALVRELSNSKDVLIKPEQGKVLEHSSLTVFSSELSVFLGKNNFQLLFDLTDWFDCADDWTYRTKTQGEDLIKGVWVNILGATTPELIQQSLPIDAIGGGLASRIIFVSERDKEKVVPAPFLTEKEEALREDLSIRIEQIKIRHGAYKYTPDFIEKYIEWYVQHNNSPPFASNPFLRQYGERKQTHVMKLAMVMNASRTDSMTLDVEDIERGLDLLSDTEKKMPTTFSGYGSASHADVMKEIMYFIQHHEKVEWHELLGTFYASLEQGEETLTMIIGILEKMNFCRRKISADGKKDVIELISRAS